MSLLLKQQHQNVLNALNSNREFYRRFMSHNVEINLYDGQTIKGYVHIIGGYFLGIKGIDNVHDENLKGKTKILYNNIKEINKF